MHQSETLLLLNKGLAEKLSWSLSTCGISLEAIKISNLYLMALEELALALRMPEFAQVQLQSWA